MTLEAKSIKVADLEAREIKVTDKSGNILAEFIIEIDPYDTEENINNEIALEAIGRVTDSGRSADDIWNWE